MREKVQKLLEFHYERPQSGNIPTKTSVTAIKEMAEEELTRKSDVEYEPIYMMQKPDFMRTEKLGTQIGTAISLWHFSILKRLRRLPKTITPTLSHPSLSASQMTVRLTAMLFRIKI